MAHAGGRPRRELGGKCSRGHLWTEENIYTRPSGYRMCRTCKNEGMARWTTTHRPVLHDYLPKLSAVEPVWSGKPVPTRWHYYWLREPLFGPTATRYIVRQFFRLNCCLPTIVLAERDNLCRVADVVIRTPKPGEPVTRRDVFWLR